MKDKTMMRLVWAIAAFAVAIILLTAIPSPAHAWGWNEKEGIKGTTNMQMFDQESTAYVVQQLQKTVPAPRITDSQERRNLVRRLKEWNAQNKLSYIYLISEMGTVMSKYVVKGKVSSVNSMLTCTQQLVKDGHGTYNGRSDVHVVDSPDLDGSYGSNGDAIFFYTSEGAYVEWNGKYMLTTMPMKLSTQPVLTRGVE